MVSRQCNFGWRFWIKIRGDNQKVPKPLIKINKKPFILYLIKNLYRQGIREFIIQLIIKIHILKKNT